MTPARVPVLIVGAGFAGLTAALMLSLRKAPCLAIDRRSAPASHPRAHGLNLRSLELLRQVPGLESDLLRASRAAADECTTVIAETVSGPPLKWLFRPGGMDTRPLSPATICTAGQDRIEPVLLRHATSLGAEVRFSTELVAFTQESDHVRAVLRHRDGSESIVNADYLIAGDGSGSAIRTKLGVRMEGRDGIAHAVSILFEADLDAVGAGRGFLLCYIRNRTFNGAFVTCDDPNRGQLNVEFDPERESVASFDPERCAKLVRIALGRDDLDVKILEVLPWRMSALVAERMKVGRIFLAGDAAHVMPPVGGLAGQTAIQDAADLAWKIAMTLAGIADPALLETYEMERRPVALLAVARATENYVERVRQDRAELSNSLGRANLLDVTMSYRYRSPAISLEETDDGSPTDDTLRPSGRPGTRLAHVTLSRDGAEISTHDLVGPGFVLLAAPSGDAWIDAAQSIVRDLGAPLTAVLIQDRSTDATGSFLARTGLRPDGALLVRPDGFIAWRSLGGHADPRKVLSEAVARASGRNMLSDAPRHEMAP